MSSAVGHQHGEDEAEVPTEGANRRQSFGSEHLPQQEEHPVGREPDQEHHEAQDHVVQILEESEHALACLSRERQGDPEEAREDDDLEHLAVGHGLDRIRREQVDQRLDHARRLFRGEPRRLEIEPRAGLDDQRGAERQRDRDRRGEEVERQRLPAHSAETREIVERRHAADDRHEHEWHDEKLQRGEEDLTTDVEDPVHEERGQGPTHPGEIDAEAHQDPGRHAQEDVQRQPLPRFAHTPTPAGGG